MHPHQTNDQLLIKINRLLQNGKPGMVAHQQMMPRGRIMAPINGEVPKQSAVLLLLYAVNDQLYFPIIRRPVYNGMHSGQMALPGGKKEDCDASLIETALREFHEEVGVEASDITILGTLSELYIHVTNIQVLPVVGFINYQPQFRIAPDEVDALFEIPMQEIFNPEIKKTESWNLRGEMVDVPFYLLSDQKVWGATAMILSEFEQLTHSLLIHGK